MLWIIYMLIFLMVLILINLSKAQQLDLFENIVFNDQFDGRFGNEIKVYLQHNLNTLFPCAVKTWHGTNYSGHNWSRLFNIDCYRMATNHNIWTSFQNDWIFGNPCSIITLKINISDVIEKNERSITWSIWFPHTHLQCNCTVRIPKET